MQFANLHYLIQNFKINELLNLKGIRLEHLLTLRIQCFYYFLFGVVF